MFTHFIRKIDFLQMSEAEFIDKFYVPHDRHVLSMSHLVAAFIVLCGGYLLATFVFIGELCWIRGMHSVI